MRLTGEAKQTYIFDYLHKHTPRHVIGVYALLKRFQNGNTAILCQDELRWTFNTKELTDLLDIAVEMLFDAGVMEASYILSGNEAIFTIKAQPSAP